MIDLELKLFKKIITEHGLHQYGSKYKYVGDVRVIGAQVGIEFLNNQRLPNKKPVNHLVKYLCY